MLVNVLTSIFWVFIIYLIIAGLWQLGERLMYGEVTPRGIDEIVTIILAISLYFNIK